MRKQRAGIEVVSGERARWITECVQECCPHAKRCTDPFHVVEWARRSRINSFKELALKIKRHKEYILNFISTGISNARGETNNNKISLLVHRSFGFKNFRNMVYLIMLVCSNLRVPLPNRAVSIENPA